MDLVYDVVLVSLHGRGSWLAAEMARLGNKVAYVQCTEEDKVEQEDILGPFGIWQPTHLSSSQREFIQNLEGVSELKEGFGVWPKSGPWELRGPFSSVRERALGLDVKTVEQLKALTDSTAVRSWQSAVPKELSASWIWYLAHSLASHLCLENADCLRLEDPIPLYAPFFKRDLVSDPAAESTSLLKEAGVEYITTSGVQDIEIDLDRVKAAQLVGVPGRLIKGQFFIWMLTSEETLVYGPSVATDLFPKGTIAPEWCWLRWSCQVQDPGVWTAWPQHVVVVHDNKLSWTHDNLAIVWKAKHENKLDVWMRVPAGQRFNQDYVAKVGEHLLHELQSRTHGSVLANMQPAWAFQKTRRGATVPRWPVYTQERLDDMYPRNFSNILYGGPEHAPRLDLAGDLSHQQQLLTRYLNRLANPKKNKNDLPPHGGVNDRPIHPS